ncbi:MAG: pyridoxal-phosphate dependent enzyme [Acidobacteriota bacterium]
MHHPQPPDRDALDQARSRLEGHAHRTPVLTCGTLDALAGARLHFKCENLQRVGAFKFRGAMNAVASLTPDERAQGVVTHSSGNHAQALALAAKLHGIPAHIVMPENAPAVKVAAVRGYGAEIIPCAANTRARETTAEDVRRRTGAVLVHPFDDARIIAGQSTVVRELLEDATRTLDAVIAPVGGGGLMSGTALAVHHFHPGVRVFGAEPAGADDAARSHAAGELIPCLDPQTLADGLRTSLSPLTFGILRRHVEAIITVGEDEIVEAMHRVWERMKIVIEPSAAVPVAAVLSGRAGLGGADVGVILSGGNVDLASLPWTRAS